jgi:hypothetical protein
MMTQRIIEPSKAEPAPLGKVKPATRNLHAAMPMIDKLIRRSKTNRRAIEILDEDQHDYLRRNAKTFLAARMKKSRNRNK